MIDEKFTIVQEDRFILATRESGYKSTASAISELADNAFQAGANKLVVHFNSKKQSYSGKGKPKSPVVQEVVCVDDGSGMTPDVLRIALRFGGTPRFNARDGLGRFGMGLPNASASQCKRLEVYTWQKPKKVYFCYIDIKEIADGKMRIVPEPVEMAIPDKYADLIDFPTGTMVIWKNCDRLDYNGREDTLTRELPKTLGQTYRYFLARGKTINVNGRNVKPFDPLFLMPEAQYHGATQHGAPLKFHVKIPGDHEKKSCVTVKFSLLPEKWQNTMGRKEMTEKGIVQSRGFSIVRAGREIDYGYFWLRSPHPTDLWWRCEIWFKPFLDELFGVTHTKQQVKLSERIRTTIENDIHANIATLADTIDSRRKKQHKGTAKRAENIAKEQDKFLKTSPDIRDKSPQVVDEELRKYAEERSKEEQSPEELIQDLKDRPLLLDFEDLPGAPFYRVRTYGKATVVTLNKEHSFFDKLYGPLCDSAPEAKTALELLLFALAKSETLASEEGHLWYKTQRHEWSRVLSVYLEELDLLNGE